MKTRLDKIRHMNTICLNTMRLHVDLTIHKNCLVCIMDRLRIPISDVCRNMIDCTSEVLITNHSIWIGDNLQLMKEIK